MGREVRRVPADWQHPRDDSGMLIPLLPESFREASERYERRQMLWADGKYEHWDGKITELSEEGMSGSFEEWCGSPPEQSHYMPDWRADETTHYMMYEDTTEGTPISPAFETPESLAQWLADNNASAFGDTTANYKDWLAMIQRGWAPSMVIDSRQARAMSGVEFMAQQQLPA